MFNTCWCWIKNAVLSAVDFINYFAYQEQFRNHQDKYESYYSNNNNRLM